MSTAKSGSCVCGSIQFTVQSHSDVKMICYCSDCRKGSGHLGQILGKFNTKDVQITDKNSTMKEYIISKTQSGFPKKKLFCGECGCTILTQPMKYNGEVSIVRTTLLDDGFPEFQPTKEIFADAKESFIGGTSNSYY
jgi:hypothetical protein